MSLVHSNESDRLNLEKVAQRAVEFGIRFTTDELRQVSVLDNPSKVQMYLSNLPYNHDDDRETAYSPKMVLKHRKAHCFEGALFAYAVNFLHGFNQEELSLVLLLGMED